LMLGSSGNDTIYPTEGLCEALGVDPQMVGCIEAVAPEQADDMKLAMLTRSSGAVWPRRAETTPIGAPNAVPAAVHQRLTGNGRFRIFCTTLAGEAGEEPANIAVVHVARPADRAAVAAKLKAADQARGISNLPMIVLSPPPQIGAGELGAAECRCRCLVTRWPSAGSSRR